MTVAIDLDDTIAKYSEHYKKKLSDNPNMPYPQSQYGFFLELEPVEGCVSLIKGIKRLGYEIIFVTRPSSKNPLSYAEKVYWIHKYFGQEGVDSLYFAPDKTRIIADYLVDDCVWKEFKGKQLLFGSKEFPDWEDVYLFFNKLLKP